MYIHTCNISYHDIYIYIDTIYTYIYIMYVCVTCMCIVLFPHFGSENDSCRFLAPAMSKPPARYKGTKRRTSNPVVPAKVGVETQRMRLDENKARFKRYSLGISIFYHNLLPWHPWHSHIVVHCFNCLVPGCRSFWIHSCAPCDLLMPSGIAVALDQKSAEAIVKDKHPPNILPHHNWNTSNIPK